MTAAQVLQRAHGQCGELVLRRRGGHLEIICGGVFLVSTANEASSRALIASARPLLPTRGLDVLIGGLGVGHALDEALGLAGLASVTVAELEPTVIDWYHRYGGDLQTRAQADARVRIVARDVADVLRSADAFYHLVALDTDNGPGWLVRPQNAVLYSPEGLALVAGALHPDGVAAFWSSSRDERFHAALEAVFRRIDLVDRKSVV